MAWGVIESYPGESYYGMIGEARTLFISISTLSLDLYNHACPSSPWLSLAHLLS